MPSTAAGAIDYSKWDKIDYGSSSENDEGDEANNKQSQPRVTRLDQPSRVTRTADGELVIEQATEAGKQQNSSHIDVAKRKSLKTNEKTIRVQSASQAIPPSWSDKGGADVVHGRLLYWCQDRYSVTLRVELPSEHSWTCEVTNFLPFDDRYRAVGSPEHAPHLVIRRQQPKGEIKPSSSTENRGDILLESDFAYPIHAEEDSGESADWSIEKLAQGKKFMAVTVLKATPMEGITLWWKRPLVDCKEIELTWRSEEGKNNAFAQAWDDAHKTFREKAGTRKRMPLP